MSLKANIRSSFQQLTPDEFESLVASVWSKMGWSTEVTSISHDRGIDVIATKSGIVSKKVIIQAKCYTSGNKVGRPEIQQYNTLKQQEPNADSVIVVTSSSFTSEALSLKQSLDVKFVNGEELAEAVIEHIPEDERAQLLNNPDNERNRLDSEPVQNISLEEISDSEKDLAKKYNNYINRLIDDMKEGKPNRRLYFHVNGEYEENEGYNPTSHYVQKDEYIVHGGNHNIKFQDDSPKIWIKFQETCKKYGWEVVKNRTMGEVEGGFRDNVNPKNADTFCIIVNTQIQDGILPIRQAKISRLIIQNIFNEDLSGMRVSDGVSGHNINRHSRIIE